jgi:hypothetical protein
MLDTRSDGVCYPRCYHESSNRNRHARTARHVSPPQPVTTTSDCSGEYRGKGTYYSTRCLHPSLTCSPPQQVSIGNLSGNVLLKIFRYYLDASPHLWPRLVHICREWRRIIFATQRKSQRPLHLRLFFTHGTPVLKTLGYWPTLSIVMNYGGFPVLDPPGPEDECDITAALRHSDRVSSISLTITSSLLEKFTAIERPFSKLKDLFLLSRDGMQLTLPSYFQWGSHLRRLRLTGVVIPALLQRISSSRCLVEIQLHFYKISCTKDLSPEAFANALSGMPQLRSLSLHFPPTLIYMAIPPPSVKRAILPALTRLDFRGITGYLGDLVARIDAPRLRDIEITFSNNFLLIRDVPRLGKFMDRIKMQKLHRKAEVLFSESSVSLSLTQPGAPTCLKVQVLCEPLGGQVYSMVQICSHFSAFLSRVEDVHISTTQPSSGHDNNCEQWLKLIRRFGGAKRLHLAGDHSTNVVRALPLLDERGENVLAALHKLCIREPEPHYAPLREAVVPFIQSYRLSGHCIAVEYNGLWTNEPHGTGATYS